MPNKADTAKIDRQSHAQARKKLLAWYDRHARALPWRAPRGVRPDPYHVWLSEIMLQQTTVTAVQPYFLKFLVLWPDIHALAAAPLEKVMKEWAGLGYYARARNLHACAKMVSKTFGGKFPDTQEDLRKLPGIGDYTSAAIAALVFNRPAVVVDGNVERVMARYFAVTVPLPKSKPALKEHAALFFGNYRARPGDLAQALMDLGATICIPRAPRCVLCPLEKKCAARKQGIATALPAKVKAAKRPQRSADIFWIEDSRGRILLQRRPPKGLLGGMVGLPTSSLEPEKTGKNDIPLKDIKAHGGKPVHVHHSFTHFDLRLTLKSAQISGKLPKTKGYYWAGRNTLHEAGMPTAFAKALKIFIA